MPQRYLKKQQKYFTINSNVLFFGIDMKKYGGPGRLKQTCEKRKCLNPQNPVLLHKNTYGSKPLATSYPTKNVPVKVPSLKQLCQIQIMGRHEYARLILSS